MLSDDYNHVLSALKDHIGASDSGTITVKAKDYEKIQEMTVKVEACLFELTNQIELIGEKGGTNG